ncbi:hypothetical protein BDZ97DRAFT_2057533 [Flammula alnicola]|nr:hypothetical protein BDZ97DRAFT_2057533 [Flammula alnicola]
MNNLKSVLESLKSEKIKERQEALTSIREVFSQDTVVARFHINRNGESNPKVWLSVFQALFTTVMLEKGVANKTSTKSGTSSATALRRLSEAASIIRWLTERTVHLINKKVAIALFQHLTQMMASDRTPDAELFKPVALDYAKALKCLASHTPHLEHLDDYLWVKMVEMSLNVILSDPINATFAQGDEEGSAIDVDSDMYMEDETAEEDEPGLPNTAAGKGKKRPRPDPTPMPILSPRKAKSQARSRRNLLTSVSLEQVEFASLLSILLASPVAPILSNEYPGLPNGILVRLQRFLERYPADSSLLHDYLTILSSTLDHLSLNKKHEIEVFARSTWVGLVGLWGTKDRRMKEGLVVVLRHLFQFVICPSFSEDTKLAFFDCADGISRLWHLLDGEAESRWGVDGLALDALRLQIIDPKDIDHGFEKAFVAKTFRAGWNFDAGQALSWANLELQADCAGKLFQLSESMHSTQAAGSMQGDTKRIKLENPITSLLHSIQTGNGSRVRNYHLQALLFFVDRYWSLVHDSLKQDIIDVLLQYVTCDDGTVQSWVFLNFAAIAYAEGSKAIRRTKDTGNALESSVWDSIWTHAIRRANVPAICRAACHAGQTLLTSLYPQSSKSSRVFLTTPRVLLEIETFAKDMDVQGPSYPFDSVCTFLSQCLTIASQDARLYRMHLEDKVLSWFVDSWKITGGGRMKMVPHTTVDILLLLETICSLSKRVALIAHPLLPENEIVDSVVEENKIKVIRDFMLYAKLPPFIQQPDTPGTSPVKTVGATTTNSSKNDAAERIQLVAPRGKERKISSFFLKTLESLIVEWEGSRENHNHPTAEMTRRSLDIAVAAIAFESLLTLNGIASNRQVLQSSAKILTMLTRLLTDPFWSVTEKLLVAHALEILILEEENSQDGAFHETLSRPGPGSGIKEQTLQRLLLQEVVGKEDSGNDRLNFLRLIWQNADVQDALGTVITVLRKVLEQILNGSSSTSHQQVVDVDDKDGFGPIRTTNLQNSATNVRKMDDDRPTQHLLEICIGFLACGPFLQSPSAEPTRDKELAQLVIASATTRPEKFCLVCPLFFSQVRQGTLSLSIKYLDGFFDKFEHLLTEYSYSRSERFHQLLLDLLTSSLGVWKSDDAKAEQVHEKFRQFCSWLSGALRSQKIRSWTLRDAFSRFLDRYLSEDPTQESWALQDEFKKEEDYQDCLPTSLLPRLNADPDMRVRFRAAVINARLYSLSDHLQALPLEMYDLMKKSYTVDVHNYEHMLTRMLSLGNIMVVSSAVRRGPYWHLLETCVHSQQYSSHIEAILTGVSERLGMPSLSVLFDAYASQIAYSLRQADGDFMTFPPHLLGYRDRKQCAEAAFRPFTPTYVLTDGRRHFESHCKVLHKSVADGLRDCFGDIVGYHITTWMDQSLDTSDDELEQHLKEKMAPLEDFRSTFEQNVDSIVTMILRSLGEQDFSESGPIVSALRSFDQTNKIASTFLSLTSHRASDTFKPHTPNLPIFPTQTILRSLLCFDRSISEMGNNLLNWIDQQAYSFSKLSIFQPVILRALAAWPHQPSSQLLALYNEITIIDLSSVLEDHHITSNKFRLVRRIREQSRVNGDTDDQYSKTYFWRLKECIPPTDRLQDEDVAAFAELLSISHGKISSFNPERPDLNAPRPRQRRMFKKRGTAEDALAQDAITLGLFMMLEDDDPSHVSNAYHTLRLVMAISSPEEPRFTPSEYRAEVEYLKAYRCSPTIRPVTDIREMLNSDLYLESASNFTQWISLITVVLSDALAVVDPFFGQLASILTSDTEFAEQVLPILVYTILSLQRIKKLEHLTFSLRELLSNYFTVVLSSASADVSCVRSIVDIVLHLRYFSPKTNDALAYNKWLEVDYSLLARSAILCGAYTTALLFVEIASEEKSHQDKDLTTEHVLYEIYAHIDEPDGFYGIKTKDLHQFLIKRFHHEKQWDKAFRFHGAALEAGSSRKGEEEGLLESFHYFGFDHLAIDTLRNFPGQSSEATTSSSSMSYNLGWRTETWDLPDQTKDASSAPLYRSLRAIYRERDPRVLENTVQSALFAEMDRLRSLGSENLAEIRSVSQDLMCLGQILQWRQENVQELLKPENMKLDKWKDFVNIDAAFEFSDLESLMATRISLVRSVRQREERQQIGSLVTSFVRGLIDVEKNCLLRLSEAARASGQIQVALNSVVRAQRLDITSSSEVSEEFANVLWLQKEERLAVQFLQGLVERDDSAGDSLTDPSRHALWLSRLGTWTSEACLEKPTEIWERYFSPSISLLEKVKDDIGQFDVLQATIYRECAMFSERQYHSTLKSPDAIRWKIQPETSKKELLSHQALAKKILIEDSERFKKHNTLRDSFLKRAIDMHSRCLETSSQFDNDSAIRFCSLWFANFDDESILESVKKALARIPSRKLVFLAHQLTARIANSPSSALPQTQVNLQSLVLRMCQEHPFHSLYQVYCLSDHSTSLAAGRRQSGRHSSPPTQTDRGTAASNIFDRLRIDEVTGERVRDVEKLCDACLQWAKYPIVGDSRFQTKQRGVPFKIPSGQKLLEISNLRVPVSTARTPVDPTMQYKDCVWIKRYDATFDTAGGINLPKISVCHGSDGQKYKQLFKGEGKDDLRQDAVMEQVFDLVNGVLKRDRETRRRDLNVRDYKVIPLASQAGILEFVGNTSPLRDWLHKSHPIYRPNDMKPHEVMLEMKKVQTKYVSQPDKQLEFFLAVRKKFKPVMRHYFTEKHKNPITWFQMRLCYARSIATTSIVGHVLGLGDRHISNILMDNVSGEVVHIDLGIAFDQGKLLTVPERVPFRMTADIVDGMGPSGTSGVFQRCAEETLRVLREESEVIMTVLEVFKHDPLHSWTASEVKVKQAQSDAPTTTSANDTNRFNLGIGIDMSSGSADEAADRALNSVARKLDKSLSVESTVNELIAEATDPMNLATIFYGWSPHM